LGFASVAFSFCGYGSENVSQGFVGKIFWYQLETEHWTSLMDGVCFVFLFFAILIIIKSSELLF
jgi:hypothetical protein